MTDNKPGTADYMLAVMQQIIDKAAVEKEITDAERENITKLNEETVRARYMTSQEWEVLA
jgi:hypothetical protein